MPKIVYNKCYGGFSLSDKAIVRYLELTGTKTYAEHDGKFTIYWLSPRREDDKDDNREAFYDRGLNRADPVLVQIVEQFGAEANGCHAELAIRELPAGTKYHINERDGFERVMTPDDYEWSIA